MHLDVPDTAFVIIVKLDIGRFLVLQGLAEFVVPFVKTVVRRVEPEELDGLPGLVNDRDIAAICSKRRGGSERKSHDQQFG